MKYSSKSGIESIMSKTKHIKAVEKDNHKLQAIPHLLHL